MLQQNYGGYAEDNLLILYPHCGDHFCLKPSVALVIDFGSESHIEGKPPHLLPYTLGIYKRQRGNVE